MLANFCRIVRGQAGVDVHVAADGPAVQCQRLKERPDARLPYRIVRDGGEEHADAPHAFTLLRARRKRPRSRAGAQRNELAPFQLGNLHPVPQKPRSEHNRLVGSEDLPQCGISIRPKSAPGQTRSFGDVGSMSGLRESGQRLGDL
jgi:hypothetical protein